MISWWAFLAFLSSTQAWCDPYTMMVQNELNTYETSRYAERLASGVAALTIGLYGYYFDERGAPLKLAYSATQTIGVLVIGDAIYEDSRISTLLVTDEFLQKMDRDRVQSSELRQALARANQLNRRAEKKKIAYTSAILTGLYLVNAGSAGSDHQNVRGIYQFLAFNTGLIAIGSFYQLWMDDASLGVALPSPHRQGSLIMNVNVRFRF